MFDINEIELYGAGDFLDPNKYNVALHHGWLPKARHQKRLCYKKGFYIDMFWEREEETYAPDIFYFCISITGIHDKRPTKFMLTIDGLAYLLRKIYSIQEKGIKEFIIQDKESDVNSRIMSKYFKEVYGRDRSLETFLPYQAEIEQKRAEVREFWESSFDRTTTPIEAIMVSEVIEKDSTWRFTRRKGYCMTISYIPSHKSGEPKNRPWRIRVQHKRRVDAPMTSPRISTFENTYVDISSEVFFEALHLMWDSYLAWFRRELN